MKFFALLALAPLALVCRPSPPSPTSLPHHKDAQHFGPGTASVAPYERTADNAGLPWQASRCRHPRLCPGVLQQGRRGELIIEL
jgi:hypothetical protein